MCARATDHCYQILFLSLLLMVVVSSGSAVVGEKDIISKSFKLLTFICISFHNKEVISSDAELQVYMVL